jgi:hypothetical protein
VSVKSELVRELEEVIAALDRRLPQLWRVGEAAIASDAAALRARAVDRLAELRREAGGEGAAIGLSYSTVAPD